MKVTIEIEFNDVNYDEIEEVEDQTLYDSIDGWIDEDEIEYLEQEEYHMSMLAQEQGL